MQAAERVAMQEQALEAKVEKYEEVQKRIMALKEDLTQNNDRAIMEKNPDTRELAIAIGRKLHQEIGALKVIKEQLEDQIRGLGGDPSKYTIQ